MITNDSTSIFSWGDKKKKKFARIKCDLCGRFIAYDDISTGEAGHCMSLPDSHYSFETWESICKKCNTK